MCTNPRKLYKKGYYKQTNYNGKLGEPYEIETYTKCGHCSQCINEKSNNWVIRNWYEAQTVKKACFITLTYAENPIFLIKEHLQKFIKRLRRYIEYHKLTTDNEKIRFFACGEYGTLHHRPHYHIIIYNWKEDYTRLKYMDINKKHNVLYESKTIKKCWGFGRTTYQEFELHEIPYITLYDTPNETEKHDYVMSRINAKEFAKKLKQKNSPYYHSKAMLKTLLKAEEEIKNQKDKYIKIKEFNTWSIGLGFRNFIDNYYKNYYNGNYDWKEYIEDKEFYTPSSWVKKLANLGNEHAIKEMLSRKAELIAKGINPNEENEKKLQVAYEHTKNITKWNEQKELVEM